MNGTNALKNQFNVRNAGEDTMEENEMQEMIRIEMPFEVYNQFIRACNTGKKIKLEKNEQTIKQLQRATPCKVKPRLHKGMIFEPLKGFRTKKEAIKFAKENSVDFNFYRLWKYQRGYVLYIGPRKEKYGGIRHRSKTGEGQYSKHKKLKEL